MASMIIYSGIGVFDSGNTLIAQGSQQLRFMGSVSVSQISGQTVVNVSGGGSVTGTPDTMAFFDNLGNINSDSYATFIQGGPLLAMDNSGLGPIPGGLGVNVLMAGSLNSAGSSAGASSQYRNLIVSGTHVTALTGTARIENGAILGKDNSITVSTTGSFMAGSLISGLSNIISLVRGTNALNILGYSNTFNSTLTTAGRMNQIIGAQNNLTGNIPLRADVFGTSNTVNINNSTSTTGNISVVGHSNSLSATNRPITNTAIVGVSNTINNFSASTLTGNCGIFGSSNTLQTQGNSFNFQIGYQNQISAIPGTGSANSLQIGHTNLLNVSSGSGDKVYQFGNNNSLTSSSAQNTSFVGINNTGSAIISGAIFMGNAHNITSSNTISNTTVVGMGSVIASGAVAVDNVGLYGNYLQAPVGISNVAVFGFYNDSADTDYSLQFGCGSFGNEFNAFGVKANNRSVDLKITNLRPVVTNSAPGQVLTIDSSLIELNTPLTISDFTAGVNNGQVVVIRQASGTSTISGGSNIATPGAVPISLTEDSSVTLIWSGIKSKWLVSALTLY